MTITAQYADSTNKTVSAMVNGGAYSIPSDAITALDGHVPSEMVTWLNAGNTA